MQPPRLTDLMYRRVAALTTPAAAAWIRLPGVPASVPKARAFVRAALPVCPRLDDLLIAVTEYADNALAWSASGCGGTIVVRVRAAATWARVEIEDDGPHPLPAAASNGWGLNIVSGVTDSCGHDIGQDGRRCAWAEVNS